MDTEKGSPSVMLFWSSWLWKKVLGSGTAISRLQVGIQLHGAGSRVSQQDRG